MLQLVELVASQLLPLESEAVDVKVCFEPAISEVEDGFIVMVNAGPWFTVREAVSNSPE